jgi:hypothetical protein
LIGLITPNGIARQGLSLSLDSSACDRGNVGEIKCRSEHKGSPIPRLKVFAVIALSLSLSLSRGRVWDVFGACERGQACALCKVMVFSQHLL